MQTCPICSKSMRGVFSAKLLNKYEVGYRQCTACGLLQTEKPYWLDEAYTNAIADADTGLVMRNSAISAKLAPLLYWGFRAKGAYLDVSGGYGMLTRLMRDYGFNYYWEDKFCQNVLARGFEADKAGQPFVALTAFEVLEHVHDPVTFIREKMREHNCQTLVFSTELYEGKSPPAKDWWYYAFATGQHISFYQRKTLEEIAKRLGLNFYSWRGMHILTDQIVQKQTLLKMAMGRFALIFAILIRRKQGSLTLQDHSKLMNSCA